MEDVPINVRFDVLKRDFENLLNDYWYESHANILANETELKKKEAYYYDMKLKWKIE